VSRTLAERAFGGESPLGRTLLANPWGGPLEEFEILGVAADIRYRDLKDPPEETLYFDSRGWSWTDWEVDFVVRTEGPPEGLVAPIREELLALDGSIPLARPRTMKAYVSDFLAVNRFALTLIGLFALVAGLLALVGLYGSLSHAVARSRREIGIRMALGSDRGRILYWVYRKGVLLLLTGIGLGLVAALGLTRFLSSLLVNVAPTDGLVFTVVASSLALVGSLACYLPARRATRTDPISVLRGE
jgi:putative ABC transport system permease protein